MEKIAFYCRVSGQEQGRNETIQTQLSKLREHYKGKKIVKEYQDICSGAYLQREGLNQLREDARNGLFSVVCVYALDRLSRKLAHQIALLEEFEKQGIKVEVLGENYENTPEGMLNRNIRGAFSEYERYKIASRMKDGKYRKAEAGKLVASYPPLGYKYVKKTENCNCEKKGEMERVVLAGPTCDSADIMYENYKPALPLSLEIGDRLYWLSTGAYTSTYSAVEFNGFPPLKTYCL